MANRKFTEQEMLTLRNSKYVLDVSPSIVHFSAEFKKLFILLPLIRTPMTFMIWKNL